MKLQSMRLEFRPRWYGRLFLSAAYMVWWMAEPFIDDMAAEDIFDGYFERICRLYVRWCMKLEWIYE